MVIGCNGKRHLAVCRHRRHGAGVAGDADQHGPEFEAPQEDGAPVFAQAGGGALVLARKKRTRGAVFFFGAVGTRAVCNFCLSRGPAGYRLTGKWGLHLQQGLPCFNRKPLGRVFPTLVVNRARRRRERSAEDAADPGQLATHPEHHGKLLFAAEEIGIAVEVLHAELPDA